MTPRDDEADRPGRVPEGEEDGDGGGASEWVERVIPGFHDATGGQREVPPAEIEAHEEAQPVPGEADFEPDVERLHRALFREARDPVEGREPAPWWVWAAAAVALFWGGWYLGRHGGRFGPAAHLAFAELREYVAEEARRGAAEAITDPIRAGFGIYTAQCQACHQQTGLGVPGAFPPLIGAEWVIGPPEVPILILLHGLQGPITVRGEVYNGAMPAWRDLLTDAEIAAVLTYIRQWDANDAPAVDAGSVARLRQATMQRQTPWTADELLQAARSPEIREALERGAADDDEETT